MKKRFLYRTLVSFLLCLLCTVNKAQEPQAYNFPEVPRYACYTDDAARCYRLIENQACYLLTLVKPWKGDERYKLTTASVGGEEHITRPNTGAVAIFSFLYRFGPYDEKQVGISRQELFHNVIIPMMRYLIRVHKTSYLTFDNDKQWGLSWQSALWTHQLAQGAITIWSDLPEEIRSGVLRVVWHEANRIAATEPPYTLTYDSKSEENAWNAGALSGALMMMPDDPHAPVWKNALQKWLLSAYIRPADAQSNQLVDGVPLKDQYKGANIFDDYTLENHGLVHPDYMNACTLKGEIMLDYLATGRSLSDACMFNVNHIYDQLKLLLLPSGGFIYPTGQDWAIFRHADWINQHAFCLYRYHDPEALYWLRISLDVIERMESRHVDGRIYGSNENFFPSSQTLAGLGLVDTWKILLLADPVEEQSPIRRANRLYPDCKFFVRRTPNAVHSIAWGKKIQFQSMSWDKDPLMAPAWGNGTGTIRLSGEKKDLPHKLQSIEIDTLSNGIRFHILLHHGDAVAAHFEVTSKDNGQLVIHEKLTALRDIRTDQISTLSFGILNHQVWIEEQGFRVVKNDGRSLHFASLSGQTNSLSGKDVVVDNRLVLKTRKPIRGTYRGAKGWHRSKLIDYIVLNDITETRSWNQGELIHENTVTLYYR